VHRKLSDFEWSLERGRRQIINPQAPWETMGFFSNPLKDLDMKNRYIAFSKKPETTHDDDLLTWKIKFDVEKMRYIVTFSDGTKKEFGSKKQARHYINEKFFDLYF